MKKIVIAVLAGIVGIGITFHVLNTIVSRAPASSVESAVDSRESKIITYSGKTGSDALTLLKQQATVEQDNSGLVVSINSVKANPPSREYWAFYVNGEMAQVGPQDYQTKDSDTIEWRLERY